MQEIYSKNKSRIYAQGQKIIGQLAWIHKTLQSLVQIKKKILEEIHGQILKCIK